MSKNNCSIYRPRLIRRQTCIYAGQCVQRGISWATHCMRQQICRTCVFVSVLLLSHAPNTTVCAVPCGARTRMNLAVILVENPSIVDAECGNRVPVLVGCNRLLLGAIQRGPALTDLIQIPEKLREPWSIGIIATPT